MKKGKADRTVRIGAPSYVIIIVLFFAAILLEIFTDVSYIIPIIFAGYTIANVGFWSVIINTQGKKWSKILLNFIIGFMALELMFIIPYIVILFIESII